MTIRADFLRGLKWTVFGRLGSQLVTWGLTIYVMRLLSPADYGLMALASIFNALLVMIAEMGLGTSIIQSKEAPPTRVRQLFGVILTSNMSASAIMAFAIAPLASIFFAEPRIQPVIQIIALQFIPAAFSVIPAAMLDREMKFRGRVVADFLSNVGGGLVIVLLAYQGFGVFSLAWGGVAQATIRTTVLILIAPDVGTPLFNFSGCGHMIRFGRYIAQNQLVWFFYSQADSFIIGKVLGKFELGIYSVSMELASLPAARISAILNQVVTPTLSKVYREGNTIENHVLAGIRGLSLVSFPVMWGFSSITPEFVDAVLGEKWAGAVMPMTLLCLIMPLRVLSPLIHSALHAVGRADASFNVTLVTAIVMVSSFLAGAQAGLKGITFAWLLIFPAVFLYNLIRSATIIKLPLAPTFGALGRPMVVAGCMYGAVATARLVLPWSPLTNLPLLILTGAITYAFGTYIFNKKALQEARAMFRRSAV